MFASRRKNKRWSPSAPNEDQLEKGLALINQRLGMYNASGRSVARAAAKIRVWKSRALNRSIFYAPDMDGHADSGEVVWVWTPTDGTDSPPRERAVLVIGRTSNSVLALLISPNPTHDHDPRWTSIGTGEWDEAGRPCWIRVDRVLEIQEKYLRRQGVLFPKRRFERIATRLRTEHQWD